MTSSDNSTLFRAFKHGSLNLTNRIVMAPMTRCFSPNGIPGKNVADYYRRRVEGGVGLIITEGTWIPHRSASNEENAPNFYGHEALAGWAQVVNDVHVAGGTIVPQLWHVGLALKPAVKELFPESAEYKDKLSPSGYISAGKKFAEAMTLAEAQAIIEAYTEAAVSAQQLGFDGLELHGAHGYLLDQFFWGETNKRSDQYGGNQVARTRFAVEVIKSIRVAVGPNFPIIFRFSQWKLQDYEVQMLTTPHILANFLAPLVDAGVDIFHCSQRRFWEAEFDESPLNLAGWTKKLTGKPTISVGSVGLDQEFLSNILTGGSSNFASLDKLITMMECGNFDLIAVGRALIANPDWPQRVKRNETKKLATYSAQSLSTLV